MVINPQDTPYSYKWLKIATQENESVAKVLHFAKLGNSSLIKEEDMVKEELLKICQEHNYAGAVVYGDPMGDPPVTYVLVNAPSWEIAQQIVSRDKDFGIKGMYAMWGCHGLYDKIDEKPKYLFEVVPHKLVELLTKGKPPLHDDILFMFWDDLIETGCVSYFNAKNRFI